MFLPLYNLCSEYTRVLELELTVQEYFAEIMQLRNKIESYEEQATMKTRDLDGSGPSNLTQQQCDQMFHMIDHMHEENNCLKIQNKELVCFAY